VYDVHAERSAGWSGLAFVVTVIAGTLLSGGQPPGIGASGSAISSFLSAHHQLALASNWLNVPETFFFLWFAVGVRAHLAHAAGRADGLPLYAVAGAIAAATIALCSTAVLGVLLLSPVPLDDLPGWWALFMLLGGPILVTATVVFVFAAAHSMWRHRSAPQALAVFGYIAALGGLVSSFSLAVPAGPMSATGPVPFILGLGLFAIWIIATSIWLIRNAGRPAPAL
jgi:hypothetical protein